VRVFFEGFIDAVSAGTAPRAYRAVVPQVVTTRALLTGAGRRSRHVTR
jgi:hypothetical protein